MEEKIKAHEDSKESKVDVEDVMKEENKEKLEELERKL